MDARAVKPMPRIEKSRPLALPARESGWALLPADRSFKVLQPSREPAQLSLFPPPGQVLRTARHGR
jgi:hypothetical protein